MESGRKTIESELENSSTQLSANNNLNICSTWDEPKPWIHIDNRLEKDLEKIRIDTPKDKFNTSLKLENSDDQNVWKLISTIDQINISDSSDKNIADLININASSICLNNEQSTLFALEIPKNTDGEAIAEDSNANNNDKTEEDKNNPDIAIEEEEEEEEKFENAVEAKDFHYFKRQCKFEKFVTQLGSNSHRSKTQSALYSFFGNSLQEPYIESEEDDQSTSNKPMIGFDTRFSYTREGLMVYDINSDIEIDEPDEQTKGITLQDYNVFRNTTPANEYDKNTRHDYYQKFKSYRNALAPFAGLEFATDHERKIYEFLPPFK